jgi:hypothetical protein
VHRRQRGESGAGALSADELVRRYCAIVYGLTGSYEQTAKQTELDWRTVKRKLSRD